MEIFSYKKCSATSAIKTTCYCLLLALAVAVILLEQQSRKQFAGLEEKIKWLGVVLNFEHDKSLENFATSLNLGDRTVNKVAGELSSAVVCQIARQIQHLDAAFARELKGNHWFYHFSYFCLLLEVRERRCWFYVVICLAPGVGLSVLQLPLFHNRFIPRRQ